MNNSNTGHGHVIPRSDGAKARCGGPAICSVCAEELRVVQENRLVMDAMKSLKKGRFNQRHNCS